MPKIIPKTENNVISLYRQYMLKTSNVAFMHGSTLMQI